MINIILLYLNNIDNLNNMYSRYFYSLDGITYICTDYPSCNFREFMDYYGISDLYNKSYKDDYKLPKSYWEYKIK